MNDLCASCNGICCQGIIEVYSGDEIFYDDTLVCEGVDMEPDRQMKLNGTFCIALKNGKCSIYEKRPQVCRDFKVGCRRCINYQNGYLNSHKMFPIGELVDISRK